MTRCSRSAVRASFSVASASWRSPSPSRRPSSPSTGSTRGSWRSGAPPSRACWPSPTSRRRRAPRPVGRAARQAGDRGRRRDSRLSRCFTSLALVTSGSAHGAIVIAVLPAATALAAVARAGERPGAHVLDRGRSRAAASSSAFVLARGLGRAHRPPTPLPARRHRLLRARLRRGRGARTRAGRRAHDQLGACVIAAAYDPGNAVRRDARRSRRGGHRVARLRLCRRRVDVPRLLRLVRRPCPRRRRADRPDPAHPAAAHRALERARPRGAAEPRSCCSPASAS